MNVGSRVQKTVRIRNQLGMHARAAGKFVKLSNHFQSDITVSKEGLTVNGKSIMGLLTLVAAWGVDIEVAAEGSDAEQAVNALTALVEEGFGEGIVNA